MERTRRLRRRLGRSHSIGFYPRGARRSPRRTGENAPGVAYRLKLRRVSLPLQVHIGRDRYKYFATLEEAQPFLSDVFNRTGIVLTITER